MMATMNRAWSATMARVEGRPTPFDNEKASLYYTYVRGLQLEGRYPRDFGLASMTPMRVRMIWGCVPWRYWPTLPDDPPFPPREPHGLDEIARRRRIDFYQRVRSSADAARALYVARYPISAALRVTGAWRRGGTNGSIEMPAPDEKFVGEHSVLLTGFDGGRFRFDNSWGERWGDGGRGWLPFQYLDRFGLGAFLPFCVPHFAPVDDDGVRLMATTPLGHTLRSIRFDEPETGERAAWAVAVERDGYLDVEDVFVVPKFRRRGYGRRLAYALLAEAADAVLPLRAWIPPEDADRAGISGIRAVMKILDLSLAPSPHPWARFVAQRHNPAISIYRLSRLDADRLPGSSRKVLCSRSWKVCSPWLALPTKAPSIRELDCE